MLIDKNSINQHHQEKGMKELQAAREAMNKAGVYLPVSHYCG